MGPLNTQMRKVAIYGRVSTEHEAQLAAFENQQAWYEGIIKKHSDWVIVDRYYDEGITGTAAQKRPAFMNMLQAARRGAFDLIVTREVCRFARNTVDTLTVTRELKRLGVEVYFIQDNIWTLDGDGELRLTIMATLAQEESRKISERVLAGQQVSREKGRLYGNGNILGYDLVAGTYQINPDQAYVVHKIFQLYADGWGYKRICNELIRLGCKNAHGEVAWKVDGIGQIIKNATYKGYICYNKSHSDGYLTKRESITGKRTMYMSKGTLNLSYRKSFGKNAPTFAVNAVPAVLGRTVICRSSVGRSRNLSGVQNCGAAAVLLFGSFCGTSTETDRKAVYPLITDGLAAALKALAGIDQLHLADMCFRLILGNKPDIGCDTGIVKAIVWQLTNGIQPVILNNVLANFTLTGTRIAREQGRSILNDSHAAIRFQFGKSIEHEQHLSIALAGQAGAEASGSTGLMLCLYSGCLPLPVDAKGRVRYAIVELIALKLIVVQCVAKLHIFRIATANEHICLSDAEGERIEFLPKAGNIRICIQLLQPFLHASKHLAGAHRHVIDSFADAISIKFNIVDQHIAHQISS